MAGTNQPTLVDNATWTPGQATTSRIAGLTLEHERGCSIDSRTNHGNLHCDCYLSRVRLIETPMGETLPTTEPDLTQRLADAETTARYWHGEYRALFRRLIWACAISGVTAIVATRALEAWVLR